LRPFASDYIPRWGRGKRHASRGEAGVMGGPAKAKTVSKGQGKKKKAADREGLVQKPRTINPTKPGIIKLQERGKRGS